MDIPSIALGTAVKIKRQIYSAVDDSLVYESPWQHNLISDYGMAIYGGTTGWQTPRAAHLATWCKIGSDNTPTKKRGSATGTTFSQTGSTVVASNNSFFTTSSAMSGSILKYGSGTEGLEQRILSVTTDKLSATTNTVSSVPAGTAATLWFAQRYVMSASPGFMSTNAYKSGAAYNSTTWSLTPPSVTDKRTFVFSQPSSQQTIYEIAWHTAGAPTETYNYSGRVVLDTPDIVTASQYYVVTLAWTQTYGPSALTPVSNVGNNIDTTGSLVWATIGSSYRTITVNSDGTSSRSGNSNYPVLGEWWYFFTTTLSACTATSEDNTRVQEPYNNLMITPGAPVTAGTNVWSGNGGPSTWGPYTVSASGSLSKTLTSPMTCYGVGTGGYLKPVYNGSAQTVVKFNTPIVFPADTFNGSMAWQATYTRSLSN